MVKRKLSCRRFLLLYFPFEALVRIAQQIEPDCEFAEVLDLISVILRLFLVSRALPLSELVQIQQIAFSESGEFGVEHPFR